MAPCYADWLCHRIGSSSGLHALFQITSMSLSGCRGLVCQATWFHSLWHLWLSWPIYFRNRPWKTHSGSFLRISDMNGYDCLAALLHSWQAVPTPAQATPSASQHSTCVQVQGTLTFLTPTNEHHCRPKVGLQEEWSRNECIPSWNLGTNISCRFPKVGFLDYYVAPFW